MGRLYTVVFEAVATTSSQDLFELVPADDKPIALHGIILSNVGGTADAGDAQEELLRLSVIRGLTASGSGGTTPTPQPLSSINTAAGFTAEVNNTTQAAGTPTVLYVDGWNVRVPYQMFFTPETRPMASQANTSMMVRMASTPADSITISGTAIVEELY